MLLLLTALLVRAEESAEESAEVPGEVPGEVLDVYEDSEVLRRRAAVITRLKEEGYREGRRKGEYTVFANRSPWRPQVLLHDDGWVRFRRQPPRIHAPGRSFADQGAPTEYLWCLLSPPSCISIGGWIVGPRKYGAIVSKVSDATHEDVRALNDAVARRELAHRLNEDIPADLQAIWSRAELPAADRRTLLYTYWDSRTDTPEGAQARDAIAAYLQGVVQASDEPFAPEELAALNAQRYTREALTLETR